MTLIKSISGIRGTIGGKTGDNLTPVDAVKFASAYGTWLKNYSKKEKLTVVIGRDARISGPMIHNLVVNTLIGLGIDVIDLGLSTTPTVEVAVPLEKADGGIILTASHNPKQWNALKLLNEKGEFLSGAEGAKILDIAEAEAFDFADVDSLGQIISNDAYMDIHIDEVLELPLVDADAIRAAKFKVVVDGVNSSGGVIIPKLLEQLGVETIELYCEPNGHFPHNPEPLKEHLGDICKLVVEQKADFGIVVDPDVDRLAFISEDGEMFGEEYTLVAVADYVLSKTPGNTVSNMSSSRALADVTSKHNGSYEASAVGEVNVVELMKKNNAVIGGEGNGGIIYPELHYGRDSLVGVALFLTHLANKKMKVSELRASYPEYYMSKNKIELTPALDVDAILVAMADKYKSEKISTVDGVKIDFAENWVHLRKSNTEPIIRIYTEAKTQQAADELALRIIEEIKAGRRALMRSFFRIALLLLVSMASAQNICGYYGTLSAEKRREMPPFANARKIVLISFFSSVYNEKITDDKGDLVIAEDSASIEQKLQIKVLREFDVTKISNSAKPKKFAAIEMAELNPSESDSLSRWFFNYRPKETAQKAYQSVGNFTPRNAVLFLDGSNRVFAYIEICFDCPKFVLVPSVSWFNEMSQLMGCAQKYEILRRLFDRKKIGYGIRKV